ncbi:hypothetical protein [Maricaulis sp. CAU 1757]
MILRRLTRHVRRQDWFAVGLDFAIVVLGVIIGLQVSTWYDAREDRFREAVVLDRLREDFQYLVTENEAVVEHDRAMQANYDTARRLLSEQPYETDPAVLGPPVFRTVGAPTLQTSSPTYDELVMTGRLQMLSDDELRRALAVHANRAETRWQDAQTWMTVVDAQQILGLSIRWYHFPEEPVVLTPEERQALLDAIGLSQLSFGAQAGYAGQIAESARDVLALLPAETAGPDSPAVTP